MPAIPSRDIRLKERPVGLPTAAAFGSGAADAPEPGPGEVQVKNLWMSVDPYMRSRMIDRRSYIPPFQIGQILEGQAVGEVVASNAEGFAPGDLVMSMRGWREAFTAEPGPAQMTKVDPHGLPPQTLLGVAGMPGLTAYVGLLDVGAPKAGETVFVSAAAGAVGSLVCQIAKIKGCKVVGSAGGAEKIAFLEEIGCDATVDYKAHPGPVALTKALSAAAPDGIDVFFENVGGDHLTAALNVMNDFGRIAVCGMIATYNDATPQPGPPNLAFLIMRRIRMEGFVVADHFGRFGAFLKDLSGWIQEGRVVWRETVREGIDTAPDAFLSLFHGGNVGKMLVKLG